MKSFFKRSLYSLIVFFVLTQSVLASNKVQLNPQYYPNPSVGKALSLADVYVGVVDLDPEVEANQKQISVLQENGTTVEVSQPITTGSGGVPLYNGSPVTILVEGTYSLKVNDRHGAQVYYVPQNNPDTTVITDELWDKIETYPTVIVGEIERNGSAFEKTAGNTEWSVDGFYSDKSYIGGCTLSYTPLVDSRAFLGFTNTQTITYTIFDYSVQMNGATLTAYAGGVSVATTSVGADPLVEMIYNGVSVIYKADNVVFHTETADKLEEFYLTSTMLDVGTAINNLEWMPYNNYDSPVVTDVSLGLTGSGDERALLESALSGLDDNTTVVFTLPQITSNGEVSITVDGLTLTTTNKTKIKANTLGEFLAMFQVEAGTGNVTFDRLELEGPVGGVYVLKEACIRFDGAVIGGQVTFPKVTNCAIRNFGSHGIEGDYCAGAVIYNNKIVDVGYAGIQFLSSTDGDISGNYITGITPGTVGDAYGISITDRGSGAAVSERWVVHGNRISDVPSWEGLDTHAGIEISFIGNIITDCALGINVGPNDQGDPPQRVTISGNTINRGTATQDGRAIGSGGHLTGPAYGVGITVTGNTITGYGDNITRDGAIMFQYTKELVISGNSIADCTGSGIALLNTNLDFSISGNTVNGIDTGVSNASGIYIDDAPHTGMISGNNINATAEYGIYVDEANYGIEFGRNRISTSNTFDVIGGEHCGYGLELYADDVVDLPLIASLGYYSFTITVTGAIAGDDVSVSSTNLTAGLRLNGVVTAANTITVSVFNGTAGALDTGSATYTATVTKINR